MNRGVHGMSVYKDATFSVNHYDKDGDLVDDCIMVHIGRTILQFSTVTELDGFIKRLEKLSKEVKQNYS